MTEIVMRRYTNLAAAIHTLRRSALTLLSPEKWDDRNDAYFLSQYRERLPAQSVLALCFARSPETYHHWRVFSHGSDGVCLEFDEVRLLADVHEAGGIRAMPVVYRQISTVLSKRPRLEELPFLKRYPYKAEREFRLIYVDREIKSEARDFSISLASIRRITLSPWMPLALADSVKATLRGMEGCQDLQISSSTLIENEKWMRVARGEGPQ